MIDVNLIFISLVLSYLFGFYYMFKGDLIRYSFASVLTSFLTFSYVYIQPLSQWVFLSSFILLQVFLVFLVSFYLKRKQLKYSSFNLVYKKELLYPIVILNIIFCLILIVKVPLGSLPWFSGDLITGRQEFNSGNSSMLRIPKYILPFLNVLILARIINCIKVREKYFLLGVFICSSILSCLYEGSKSSFISYFVLINGFFFVMSIKSLVLTRSKLLILGIGVFFVFFTILKTVESSSNGMDLGEFFAERLLVSNANSYEKVFDYVKYRGYYTDFLYSPFQIFINNLTGYAEENKYLFPSLGNYLESDYTTPGEFETLVPCFLEGYVAFGVFGAVFFLLIIFMIIFLILRKILINKQKQNPLNCVFYYFLFYECVAVLFRGKFSNSITSSLLTLLPFYILLFILSSLRKKEN